MQYLRSYEYIFENPNWFKNILLCTVCALIPIEEYLRRGGMEVCE